MANQYSDLNINLKDFDLKLQTFGTKPDIFLKNECFGFKI